MNLYKTSKIMKFRDGSYTCTMYAGEQAGFDYQSNNDKTCT